MTPHRNHVLEALPAHWIGIKRDWQTGSAEPWRHFVSYPPDAMKTHALVLGKSGRGKTTLLIHLMAQDIALGKSFVIIDMRGDLVNAVLELAAGHVDPKRVFLLDLRERQRPSGFNPLAGAGEPYFRALHVLDAVAAEADSWGPQLAETLRNALLLLSESQAPLTALEPLLYNPDVRLSLIQRARTEDLRAFWHRYHELKLERQAVLASAVMNKISLLLSPEVIRMVLGHQSPMNLGQAVNTPGTIILVSLAVDELSEAGRMFGNLFLAALTREIFARIPIPETQRVPLNLYVDEFEHFKSLNFEEVLAEGRRFRLSLLLSHQVLAQTSPRLRSIVLGGVGTKFIFGLGRDDSAVLSRDIFGDSRAFDFTKLSIGNAVLWRSGEEPIEVEVNEPLLPTSETLSAEGKAFRDAILSRNPIAASDPPRSRPMPALESAKEATVHSSPAKTRAHGENKNPEQAPPALIEEDWLCS